MDPVTQSALGASLAQTQSNSNKVWAAAILGCIGGLAPDLDVLISSSEDPLLFLEYHRQFTHSLIFIPFGSLLVSLFFLERKRDSNTYVLVGGRHLFIRINQGRPGTARTGGPGDLWHGPARKIMARKILARHGTENIGTEKYWHDMARTNCITLFFWEICWVEKSETFS